MGSILVRYEKSKKFRMWNTVVDMWVSEKMNRIEAIKYCTENEDMTEKEAVERVDRVKYKKDHLKWLKKYFDSQVAQLQKMHRERKQSWRRL